AMTTTAWKKGVNGDFGDAGKWTFGVPDASETALLTAPGTYTVTDFGPFVRVAALHMAKGATLDIFGTFDLGGTGVGALAGTINVGASSTLEFGPPFVPVRNPDQFKNTGTINIGDHATLRIDGKVHLIGDGAIVLGGIGAEITGAGSLQNGNRSSGNTI